jgi:hypothetical protein
MWFGAQRAGTPAEKASFARRGAEKSVESYRSARRLFIAHRGLCEFAFTGPVARGHHATRTPSPQTRTNNPVRELYAAAMGLDCAAM